MKQVLTTIAMLLAIAMPAVYAIDSDQVRGEVTEVNTDTRQISVRVLESGADQAARVGQIETYDVPPGTNFEYEVDSVLYRLTDTLDLSDLSEGDRLLLDFAEVDQRREATNVRNEETQDMAMRDRAKNEGTPVDDDKIEVPAANRDSLPESASPLPLLALTGALFAVLAGTLRRLRKH